MNQSQLASLLTSDRIPHALLFTGSDRLGKKNAAYQFALSRLNTQKKLENHPDIHLLFPEGKLGLHPIHAIRQLIYDAALAPYESEWKIFIIHETEKMLPTSSNALLKILEEPPPQTLFLLLSEFQEKLLPTLVSRCQVFTFSDPNFLPIDQKTVELLKEGVTRDKLINFESENPEAVFETLLLWYRDRALLEMDGCEAYLHFPKCRAELQKTPFIPLEIVDHAARQARLGFERSTKLSTCLELYFLSIHSMYS